MYNENKIKLNKGDRVFLYTDGVTEANNKDKKMFGNDRLLNYLNGTTNKPLTDTLKGLKNEVDTFSIGVEQYDDITMLIVEYKGNIEPLDVKKETFNNTREDVERSLNFIKKVLEDDKYSTSIFHDTMTCYEEMFLNVSSYAYEKEGKIDVIYKRYDKYFTITFIDSGTRFNPLEKAPNPLSLKDKNRKPGGFGITMVKKMMDNVTYRYENNQNVLTIRKNFEKN